MANKRTRFLSLFLIFLGGILLLGGVVYWRYAGRLAHPQPAPLPEQLAGLPLARHTFGAAAVEEINHLHNLQFPLVSGAVGEYGDGKQAVVWASGTVNTFAAVRLTAAMTARINEGNSPFSLPVEVQVDGRKVYALDGLGQKHFYFRSGSLLIWLAADEEIAEQALSECLAFYR